MEQEAMIVAVNANTANPHYMPTKERTAINAAISC